MSRPRACLSKPYAVSPRSTVPSQLFTGSIVPTAAAAQGRRGVGAAKKEPAGRRRRNGTGNTDGWQGVGGAGAQQAVPKAACPDGQRHDGHRRLSRTSGAAPAARLPASRGPGRSRHAGRGGGEGEKGGNMRMDTACISLETCMMLSEQSTPPCTWPKKNTVNNARGGHVWKLEGRRSSSGPTAAQGLPPRASLPPEDEVRQRPRFHERGSARREAGMRAVCYSVNAANKIKAATSRMSSLSSCGGLRVTGPVPRVSSPSSPPPSRSRSDRPSSPFSPSSPPPPLPGRRPLRAYVHAHAKMLRPSAVARSPAAGEGLSALPPPLLPLLPRPAPPRPAPPRPHGLRSNLWTIR